MSQKPATENDTIYKPPFVRTSQSIEEREALVGRMLAALKKIAGPGTLFPHVHKEVQGLDNTPDAIRVSLHYTNEDIRAAQEKVADAKAALEQAEAELNALPNKIPMHREMYRAMLYARNKLRLNEQHFDMSSYDTHYVGSMCYETERDENRRSNQLIGGLKITAQPSVLASIVNTLED